MDALIEAQRKAEADKLAARKELLKNRRRNKKNQEIEEKRLEEKVKQLKEQDKAEEETTEQYVKDLLGAAVQENNEKLERKLKEEALADDGQSEPSVGRQPSLRRKATTADEAKKRKERFMNLLNEKMADADTERYANLLAKQYVEKDGNMKLLLQKVADDRLAETENVKEKFKKDREMLDELKDQGVIEVDTHKEKSKQMQVDEANAVRDMMLAFEKAHKEQEAAVRQ
jgi:hypothetical protein